MSCKLCNFFDEINEFGKCRRNPPTIDQSGIGSSMDAIWPEVQPDDWCGEYQFADEKLHVGSDNLTTNATELAKRCAKCQSYYDPTGICQGCGSQDPANPLI